MWTSLKILQSTPARFTAIKQTGNGKCWTRGGEIRTLIHGWWECQIVQPLWFGNCSKVKHRVAL